MTAAPLNEIKRELAARDAGELLAICLRLAKYKKENKELLDYLLFQEHDESGFINSVKGEIADQFKTVPVGTNTYYVKKSLRKILRFVNRMTRYSNRPETDLECRLYFCVKIAEAGIPLPEGSVLQNLYRQQLKKIKATVARLPEDLQADYSREMDKALAWK